MKKSGIFFIECFWFCILDFFRRMLEDILEAAAGLADGVLKVHHQAVAAGIAEQKSEFGQFGGILGELVAGGGVEQAEPAFDGSQEAVTAVEELIIIG